MQKGAFLNFDDAYTEIFEYIEIYRSGDPVQSKKKTFWYKL
jgi:hypothetical protein